MINYLVLATEITIFEALEIKKQLGLEAKDKSEALTDEYKQQGITKLGVWIDHDKILAEPNVKNCTLNVTVNSRQFYRNGNMDAEKVLHTLDRILSGIKLEDVAWKLQNIGFSYIYSGEFAKEYVSLLNSGHSLSSLGFSKSLDDKRKPQELKLSNKSIKLTFKFNEESNDLHLSMWLLKTKVAAMADKYGVEQRLYREYSSHLKEMEWYLWSDYIKKIAGEEDYYSYKQAECMIDATDKSKTIKENMKNVLKGIAVYKGLEHYLRHVTDEEATYEFMETIHTVDTAQRYILLLKKEAINPVGISRRYAKETGIQHIPNFISVLQEEDITKYRKTRMVPQINEEDLPDIVIEQRKMLATAEVIVPEMPFDY